MATAFKVKKLKSVTLELFKMKSGVEYYLDYQIRYMADGQEYKKYAGSGLPPSAQEPSGDSLKLLPKDCRYAIRYHPGMPDKAEVSPR